MAERSTKTCRRHVQTAWRPGGGDAPPEGTGGVAVAKGPVQQRAGLQDRYCRATFNKARPPLNPISKTAFTVTPERPSKTGAFTVILQAVQGRANWRLVNQGAG